MLCFVRDVASTFTRAIQQFSEGTIDAAQAQRQHDAYVTALRQNPHVADVIHVPADDRFPDCVFIEDTAVYANGRCVITNPGAESRRGEEAAVRDSIKAAAPLAAGVTLMAEMHGGATCDGGDVLATDDVMFVGISSRTNMHGFRALASAVGTHCDAGRLGDGERRYAQSACTHRTVKPSRRIGDLLRVAVVHDPLRCPR